MCVDRIEMLLEVPENCFSDVLVPRQKKTLHKCSLFQEVCFFEDWPWTCVGWMGCCINLIFLPTAISIAGVRPVRTIKLIPRRRSLNVTVDEQRVYCSFAMRVLYQLPVLTMVVFSCHFCRVEEVYCKHILLHYAEGTA